MGWVRGLGPRVIMTEIVVTRLQRHGSCALTKCRPSVDQLVWPTVRRNVSTRWMSEYQRTACDGGVREGVRERGHGRAGTGGCANWQGTRGICNP